MTSPFDLTNLADCKAWLGLSTSTDDAVLSGLITSISQAILADLGRRVTPATYTETFEGGQTSMPLRQWPVTEILTCSVDGVSLSPLASTGGGGYLLDAADTAPPGGMQSLSVRGLTFGIGLGAVSITYRAGYEIRGETANVPTAAPYTLAAQAPFGAWVGDSSVVDCPGAYTVEGGVYTFTGAAAGVQVAVSYGYVPADLARAAIEWVADRYVARTRIGQSAKTLGGQETASFIVKAMPDFVSRLLQPYRRVAR